MPIFPCKTIRIPDDLAGVTTFRPAEEANPSEAGMEEEGVNAIWSGVEDLYRSGIHPAISFCLRRQGKVVLKRAIGHARGNWPDDAPGVEKSPCHTRYPYLSVFCIQGGHRHAHPLVG